jgi:hypothetical protein
MLVPFEQLSDQSKVWIYATQAPFTRDQIDCITHELKAFTANWQAHGADLKASFEIKYNHFIVIGVDEEHHAPSGCSIDKSVQVIKNIESKLNIDLMNRMVVYVLEGDSVQIIKSKDIPAAIESGSLHTDSQVFDNTITGMVKYRTHWISSAQSTWLNRYFTLV